MKNQTENFSAPSVSELRSSYFATKHAESPHRETLSPKHKVTLTPVARQVVELARQEISDHLLPSEDGSDNEAGLFELVRSIEKKHGEELSSQERVAAVSVLGFCSLDYDILSPLIENPEVNDIIVRSWNDVSVQVGRRNIETDLRFSSHSAYKAFIENVLKRVGKSCSSATPVVDAAIGSNIRICVTHESFSPPGNGPMLTIRVSRHREVSLEDLVRYELAPGVVLEYIATILSEGRGTVLVAGEVATGKTTLVKALAQRLPTHESILIIEDTFELSLKRPFVRTLLTREANSEGCGCIEPAQAIRTGMRMAMNRVILGEMRDALAAEAFVDVAASGHPGLTTIHARSARDALARLELFLSRAQPGVGFETLRKQVADSVDLVVHIGLEQASGRRRIMEVIEVGHSAEGSVQVSPMFFLGNDRQGSWERGTGLSRFEDELQSKGLELPKPGALINLEPEAVYKSYCFDNLTNR